MSDSKEMEDILIKLSQQESLGVLAKDEDELRRDESSLKKGGFIKPVNQQAKAMASVITAIERVGDTGFFADEREVKRDENVIFNRPSWFTQEDYEALTGRGRIKSPLKQDKTVEQKEPDLKDHESNEMSSDEINVVFHEAQNFARECEIDTLLQLCERFIVENKISSNAAILALGGDQTRMTDFLKKVCQIVGYFIDGQFFVPRS